MKPARLYELDALRGIAAIMVVLYHYFYHYNRTYGHPFEIPGWIRLGSTGVDLFFMISGFVILWTVTRARHPMDFVFSRFSRLYPAFWAAVILTFTFTTLVGPDNREVSWEAFFVNLTMFHEFVGYPHVDGVYWTLSVELAFYILALTAMICGLLKFTDYICIVWLAASYAHVLTGVDVGILEQALLLEFNMLFIIGIALYRYWSGQARVMPVACILAAVALMYLRFPIEIAITTTAWAGVFTLAVMGHLRWLNQRTLTWLGSISYTLYLIHQNIGYGIIQWGYSVGMPPGVSIVFALIVSMALAQTITTFVERPALSRLRAWHKTRQSQLALTS